MMKRGFTLLELLIVVAVIAILATFGAGFYRNFVKKIELDSTASALISNLKNAREKSISGEDDARWGVHIVNGSEDYYEIFSGTSYAAGSVASTTTLPQGILFTDPTEGNTRDILFTKVTGTTTAATISFSSGEMTKTLTVTTLGHVN